MIVNKITAWSYSRLRDYMKCPQLARFKYVDKLPEPESPALVRGKAVHDELQAFVEGRVKHTSAEVGPHYLLALQGLKKKPGVMCEQQWAFNKDWQVVDWFASDVYLRVKTDVYYIEKKVLEIIDHKTGKHRPGEYKDQMQQYLAAGLLMFPHIDEAHVRLWFHDTGDMAQARLTRPYLKEVLDKMSAMAAPMLADRVFRATPGDYCRWCPFSKRREGPCKEG